MSIIGPEESGPIKVGVALVNVLAALHATVGVLAALRLRDATGVGQRVDVTMLRSLLASLANQVTAFLGTGVSPGRVSNQLRSIAPNQTLHGHDGEIALACGNDRQLRNLCAALGIDELSGDRRFPTNTERVSHRDESITLSQTATTTFPFKIYLTSLSVTATEAYPR